MCLNLLDESQRAEDTSASTGHILLTSPLPHNIVNIETNLPGYSYLALPAKSTQLSIRERTGSASPLSIEGCSYMGIHTVATCKTEAGIPGWYLEWHTGRYPRHH
jgi:hypothetical protein